jgi:tRNA nucleotidyltransferase (CCA-adding enzyme)
VARLKCKYPEFNIDPSTLELMKRISGEASFKELSGERILAELKGALLTNRPSIFFQVLKEVHAIDVHFPGLKPQRIDVLDKVCRLSPDLAIRFASLMHEGKRLLIPNDWLEASIAVTRFQPRVHSIEQAQANSIVKMFYEMDAFRKPHLVHILALVSEGDKMGEQGKFMEKCFQAVMNVSSKDVEARFAGKEIGDAIQAERVKRLESFLKAPIE